MFFAGPNLDSRYNLHLVFDKTLFFADPKLDSRYNLHLVFDKTIFFGLQLQPVYVFDKTMFNVHCA